MFVCAMLSYCVANLLQSFTCFSELSNSSGKFGVFRWRGPSDVCGNKLVDGRFTRKKLYWSDLFIKGVATRQCPCRPQADHNQIDDPLPLLVFKIITHFKNRMCKI